MLKIIQIGSTYEVRVESSNKLIGHFTPEVDGFFYFSVEQYNGGVWSDYALLEIGNKLKEINQPWVDKLNKEFSN